MTGTELLSVIEFREPLWFLLVLVPLTSIIFNLFKSAKVLPESHFDPTMSYWYINHTPSLFAARRRLFIVNTLFWIFLAVTLAGPEYPENQAEVSQENGDTLMVLLDVSATMNTTDEKPSRLIRAKTELMILADNLTPGDKMGVILFAGSAHVLFQPTHEKQVILFYLNQIRPDMLPVAGSQPDLAIALATEILAKNSLSDSAHMLLISDGDCTQKDQVLNNIAQLKPLIPVYTLGIGLEVDAPVPASKPESQWLTINNKIITSNRDESFLRQISSITQADYHAMTDSQSDLDSLYKHGIKSATTDSHDQYNRNWIQLYQPFLLISLMLFCYRHLFFTDN